MATNNISLACQVDGSTIGIFPRVFRLANTYTCSSMHFMLFLHRIHFNYFCSALLLLIVGISIFEPYRWFILNQAIWDLFITYDNICYNLVAIRYGHENPICVYYFPYSDNTRMEKFVHEFFSNSMIQNAYSACLLLTFSRVLSLFLPNLYKKLSQRRWIVVWIGGYNLVFLTVSFLAALMARVYKEAEMDFTNACSNLDDEQYQACYTKNNDALAISNNVYKILLKLNDLKPPICLGFASIFAIFIIYKLFQLLNLQRKHKNQKEFLSNLRISTVILLQFFLNLFVFSCEIANNIYRAGPLSMTAIAVGNYPWWMNDVYGFIADDALQLYRLLRVFIESGLILFIMTGYRESLIMGFKFGIFVIFHPRKACRRRNLVSASRRDRFVTIASSKV